MSRFGKSDPEPCDDTPIAMPLGACRPQPIQDLIAQMVQTALANEKGEDFETMDEANDFEEEDPDVLDMSPYTLQDLEPEPAAIPLPPPPDPEPPKQTAPEADPDAETDGKP